MADNRVKVAKTLYLDLSNEDFERFSQESNMSALISSLLEEHYNDNIVKVKIDEKIRDDYNNDIFKDFRIPMLLLEFYMQGNNIGSKNETNISSNKVNTIDTTKHIYEEVKESTSSDNKYTSDNNDTMEVENETESINDIEEIKDTENQKPIEKLAIEEQEVNTDKAISKNEDEKISSSEEEKSIVEENLDKLNAVTKVFIQDEDDIQDTSSDNKNNKIKNNVVEQSKEVPKDIPENLEKDKTNNKSFAQRTPKTGKLSDLLGAKNPKSIL